jgi:CRP-like cAMP-binding protein
MNHINGSGDIAPETAEALAAFSPAVANAWRASFMAAFPNEVARLLLSSARETRTAAGEIFYRGAYHQQMAMLGLVTEGLFRIYLSADTGRQVTVHYAGPGQVVGAPALLLGGTEHDSERARQAWLMLGGAKVHGEALRASAMLRFSPSQFVRLVRTEASVAWALASYLARRAVESQQLLADDMFQPVHYRVARHIIALAVVEGEHMVVPAGHQEIADAIGSVREVVSRALADMRRDGLVARRGSQTVITDIARLRATVFAKPRHYGGACGTDATGRRR